LNASAYASGTSIHRRPSSINVVRRPNGVGRIVGMMGYGRKQLIDVRSAAGDSQESLEHSISCVRSRQSAVSTAARITTADASMSERRR
jgi:hypothetical protein